MASTDAWKCDAAPRTHAHSTNAACPRYLLDFGSKKQRIFRHSKPTLPSQNQLQKLAREDMHRKKYSTSRYKSTRMVTVHYLPSRWHAALHVSPQNSHSKGKKMARAHVLCSREKIKCVKLVSGRTDCPQCAGAQTLY